MEDWETQIALEAIQEAQTEGFPATVPYKFFGFAKDPFFSMLPLEVDINERKEFFGHIRMIDIVKQAVTMITAAYINKLKIYEESYRNNNEYASSSIPNVLLCGPPRSGRTTLSRYLVSMLNKPDVWGSGAAMLVNTRDWSTMGASVADGVLRWLDPVLRNEDGFPSLEGLRVLFIDDADYILNMLTTIHAQIHDLTHGPVILVPIITPIAYDFLAEYQCEQDPDTDKLFGLSTKATSAPLTLFLPRWSTDELCKMVQNRLRVARGQMPPEENELAPFSVNILEEISRHSLGLPGEVIELAENLMRRSVHRGLQECDESYLEFFKTRLGITTAERILCGALEERQMILTSGFKVPDRADETSLSFRDTRKDIIEVILRQIVLFDDREVQAVEISKGIDKERSTLSYHLTNLVKDGVLSESRHGKSVSYSIRKPVEAALQMTLSSNFLSLVM
ncbi:MAG: hypothetical protein ACE5I5_10250 [Candidatus Heimdallarchaeota archaeon]